MAKKQRRVTDIPQPGRFRRRQQRIFFVRVLVVAATFAAGFALGYKALNSPYQSVETGRYVVTVHTITGAVEAKPVPPGADAGDDS